MMKKNLLFLSAIVLLASCANAPETGEAPQYESQAIDLPGVPNARQLGGYVIGDKVIRKDVLIRSGALAKASDESLQTLHDTYNLALVADFRTSMERGHAPDRAVEGAQNVWIPVLEKLMEGEEGAKMAALHLNKDNPAYAIELIKQAEVQASLRSSYEVIVFDEDHQHSYASFLDSLVALPEGRAALWHCSHGKDRCGWGTAFVLAALGADRDLIVADFAFSNIPYQDDIDTLAAVAQEPSPEMMEDIYLLRGVSVSYFEKTLDEIDARFGSMDNFLGQALDLTPDEKRILRDKFLEDRK